MKDMSTVTKAYILMIILSGSFLAVTGVLQLRLHLNGPLLVTLAALGSLSLVFKVTGATQRLHYNLSFLIYAFTLVLLGLPETIFVILISNIVDWIYHRYPWYIQLFNIGAYMLVVYATWIAYTRINALPDYPGVVGVMSLTGGMALFTLLNHFLVGVVVWLARGENFKTSGVFDPLPLMIDYTMLCLGAGAALLWVINPFTIVFALVPLYLIYNTLKVPALERQTETDSKTGLYNARYFLDSLKSEFARARRFNRPFTLVMADLDLLRNINNTYGHLAGDQVLIGIANILKQNTRDYDVVARFGGEEFSIMIPESSPQEVFHRVEAIREAICRADFMVPTSATPIKATMSFGIAGVEADTEAADDIIHRADAALYQAKLKGRNRTFIYSTEYDDRVFARPEVGGQAVTEGDPLADHPSAVSDGSTTDPQSAPPLAGSSEKTLPVAARRKRPLPLINLYIGGMVALAAALFAITYRASFEVQLADLMIFAAIVMLTEGFSVEIYARKTSVSTSAAPILVGVLLFGPLAAVVLSLLFAIVAMIKNRSPLERFIFNAANQIVAALLYTGLIRLLGISFADSPPMMQLFLTLVSIMVVFFSTTLGVATAIHFSLNAPLKDIWKEQFAWLLPYYGVMGLIAYGLLFSYIYEGWLGVTIILVPLFLLRFSQVQYLDRTKAVVVALQEKNASIEKHAREIDRLNDALLETLAEVIDMRNPFVRWHSRQVASYAVMIAKKLNLGSQRIELIRRGGLLHDIGKVGIPDNILLKPGTLDPDEYRVIQSHSLLGDELIKKSYALTGLGPIIRCHHERFDGRGYPNGLKGEEIPLEARIVAVADAVDAMASDRPYRSALRSSEIVMEIKQNMGLQFDPVVVNAFLDILEVEGLGLLENSAQKFGDQKAARYFEWAELKKLEPQRRLR